MTQPDLLAEIIGDVLVRADRPDIVRHTQRSHDVLMSPVEPGGLSLAERAQVAGRVAALFSHEALTAHYKLMLDRGGSPVAASDARLACILEHTTRVTTAPGTATRADLDVLRAHGLSPRDIVAMSQIIAFVSYQVRAAAGLALLAKDSAA